ncbi:Acyl-coenzyme A thioesterase THEM4 [Micractinium conductrix]|uniref:Acyl-coenzyme A thioesterase THEM4 n=1 Tax=Micractinium conductrix TaxID=554055 RepID=A0A2P6V0I5_9CHLO|nr:Acyl-coenzyme A thioesterase THEM4 [Micractinium conductrix]|eukprot:PSC67606.1 Acyl-coenzyme A thioesterase THEM4 [Micractinium conductrix]
MQGLGVAAHDAIEQERSLSAEARLGGSPRASQLRAAPREPQAHTGPTLIERELGEELHPDHTARLGHPGVDCHHLPAGHAHRLTPYKAAYDKQHPEEAGAPPLSASADEGQGERHGAREALKPWGSLPQAADGKLAPRPRSSNPAPDWLPAIEHAPDMRKVMDADMLLADSHPILGDDHMFSAFVAQGLLENLDGYYDSQLRRFHAVVALGRNTCGHPRVVHGGLTAAIIDESLGGLIFAIMQDKQAAAELPWPMYTVQLDVSYKQKIGAGATVLCTTEIESVDGRKVWMKATMSDGPAGAVYATARALFVSPKPRS